MCVFTVCAQPLWRPEEGSEPLELKLQMVVRHVWVLGNEPGPLQEQVLLTTRPSLQSLVYLPGDFFPLLKCRGCSYLDLNTD